MSLSYFQMFSLKTAVFELSFWVHTDPVLQVKATLTCLYRLRPANHCSKVAAQKCTDYSLISIEADRE